MKTPQDVLNFWLDEIGPKGWYAGGETLDAEVRDKFLTTWERAADGHLGLWLTCASETLAYIILTDQLTRNMFRNDAQAFSTDGLARAAAKLAINNDWDMRIDEPARQFFYLPLMHSENLTDQDRAVRLIHSRMPETGENNIDHAKAHREIIRRFGRFPYRNAALHRVSTQAEQDFMSNGGYGAILRKVQAEAA
ncbi:Uncharacterized conserved protein, DUF924 family [Cognatiyoonia koreensis]|uniref:Uncharacterized conserved protein, DUF924 family n=1 Tax=Cognatiyoonia koreensis TaxID=364200 RepID=A0A1I0PN94_9RHOB|nr:DUF924 family protein [Cognatiyoonia koreensis]SEW15826.1 Uncharacterized conserved protein, DUF924 family [Cognatiyoonia koreensis]